MLTAHALEGLRRLSRVRLIGSHGPAGRVPVFSFTVDGVGSGAVVKAADDAGIAIRAGDLAAVPLLRRFGIENAVRASCYLYNTTDEIDRLVSVLQSL